MSSIISKYYRWRSAWWRLERLIFMSPAEVRFVQLMGGRVITFKFLKHPRTHFPAVYVVTLGRVLKRQNFKREVRYSSKFVDFANDLDRIIEIDGAEFHDPVADMEREIYIHGRHPNTRFMRIQAHRLWNDSANVQRKVMAFID